MRTSILSTFLLGILAASIPLLAFAEDAFLDSTNKQFKPKSTIAPPPLFPLPLEVKRVQIKMHHRPAKHPKHKLLFAPLKRHHRFSRCIVYPGSLRSNIRRIAGEYGWHRVVWTLPKDYRWVGKTRISAKGLFGILGKLLKDYPLQAEFYKDNHVLVIVPRTI